MYHFRIQSRTLNYTPVCHTTLNTAKIFLNYLITIFAVACVVHRLIVVSHIVCVIEGYNDIRYIIHLFAIERSTLLFHRSTESCLSQYTHVSLSLVTFTRISALVRHKLYTAIVKASIH